MLTYSKKHKLFVWKGPFEHRHHAKDAGFVWHDAGKAYVTPSKYVAALVPEGKEDESTTAVLKQVRDNKLFSGMFNFPSSYGAAPKGLRYHKFQHWGIAYLVRRLRERGAALCADEQGLGKTIEAIGVANRLRAEKVLVIAPASLRLNWLKELQKWHFWDSGIEVLLTGKDKPDPKRSVVTSYSLLDNLGDYRPDLIIIDEAHYLKSYGPHLKNYGTKRAKQIFGTGTKKWPGMMNQAHTLFLTGTPCPNRPDEIWPILFNAAPEAVDDMKYKAYVERFCETEHSVCGTKVVGAKRTEELSMRLRGSGFMLRRLKKDVLPELPPKINKIVTFSPNGKIRKILTQERNFSAQEIFKHGIPEGSALPDIRREMGLAKLPLCVEYISNLLEGGVEKAIIFAHHIDVVAGLTEALDVYNPRMIIGSTATKKRQANVEAFQSDLTVRLIIGNKAMEEGHTLTAGADVVHAEPEWVPGQLDQRADRAHRIGQTKGVLIHYLVVEGSLDAKILGMAMSKSEDINQIVN
jgi:SWI/SNF-related matrix-associated actin-dependent regulator 1 of chromatin subfamily A